jgi:peptide/nickel transport system substrate-binding protein
VAFRHSRSALTKSLALLLTLSFVAAACGGGDDDESAAGGEGAENTESTEDNGEPVHGGTLVYAVDSDTANAWAPYRASYAISGYIPLQSVADTLFGTNEDLDWVPNLAESVESSPDFTQWTMQIREGISFHDGTPLDAAAVKFNIETCVNSALVGPAYSNIGEMVAEGQTLTITTKTSPWVVLPKYFTGGSCAFMMSPEWLKSLPDVPHRVEGSPVYDPALAATPADGDPAAPVGTGPFVFESYAPGNGNSFKAVRNEDYWRGDGPNSLTDEGLPYLDAIEVVVAVDVDSRANGLRSGQSDVIHTANADTIVEFQQDGGFEVVNSDAYSETNYVMLNVAQGTNPMLGSPMDPAGANADSPMIHQSCRRALAHAIDQERLNEERGGGISNPANGPFPEGSVGYLEDTGYPAYDLDAAATEMEACLEATGTESIDFAFNTTNDPFNVETNTLIISMWQEAFGDQLSATITPIEQGQYIGLGLTGAFEALAWRSHGGTDPDQQLLWWISATASPIGELALNFGRITDPVIDENLLVVRTNPDPAVRQEAAENINRQFGEQAYNLWLTWAQWGIISEPHVNDVTSTDLAFGETGIPLGGGRHGITQIWCTDGTCES